ncbi:MAG: enolase C-terminal domain-like protein, partial [Haliea sp.]
MKITGFDVTKVRVPAKGNYQMARGTHDSLRTVVVRLYTDKGIVGVGDAHQGVEGYTAETIDTMHTIIASVYGPALIGRDVQAVEAIHADLTDARMGNLFARCAVELALFDALAKFHELGITELLGGPVRKQLKLVGGMGIASPEQMADQAKKMVSAGYKTLKIKIGRPNIQEDLTCIKAVRDRVGDDISIRVDANAAYNLVDALIVARGCADVGVEHLEQPVAKDDIDGMVRVRQLGAVAILADESVHTAEDAYRIIKVGGADAIKIKISKVGGYINARKIIDICEAAGMRVFLGQG